MTNVVLLWLVYRVTQSGIAVAYVGISQTIAGIIFSLPSGTLVDRQDRKRLMILSDLIRAGAIGFLALFLTSIGFNLLVVVIASFVVSGVSALFQPAEKALLPNFVPQESISDANGLVYSSRSFIGFAGSAAAGVLITAVGVSASLFYNVATFSASALLLFFIRGPKSPRSAERRSSPNLFAETKEGLVWLLKHPGLFQLTLSAMVLNFFFTICLSFYVVYASSVLLGDSVMFGALFGMFVMGNGIGSLLVGRTSALKHTGKVWLIGYGIACGALVFLLVLFPEAIVAIPTSFCLGLFSGFVDVTWLTTAQLLVPSEMQGRYFGVDALGSWAILPLSQLVGGLLIDRQGILWTYTLVSAGLLTTGVLFLLPRSLRRLRVERDANDQQAR